jgi:hypothetical protein
MAGRARFTEESMNGVRKELNEAMSRADHRWALSSGSMNTGEEDIFVF